MILVTGGLGFLGAHLARRLLDSGERVVVGAHRRTNLPPVLQGLQVPGPVVARLDVADADSVSQVFESHPIRSVVHLAVSPISQADFDADFRTNVQGLLNLLTQAGRAGVQVVTVASSIAVYRSLGRGPFRESDGLPAASGIPTEAFKKAEEILALHVASQKRLDVRLVRLASIYGPLYRTLLNAPSRIVHQNVRGRDLQTTAGRLAVPAGAANDFCHVDDAVDGLHRIHRATSLPQRIYNVGSGTSVTGPQILAAVQRVLPGAAFAFAEGGGTPADNHMDIELARRDVGYRPRVELADGVARYVRWLDAGHEF